MNLAYITNIEYSVRVEGTEGNDTIVNGGYNEYNIGPYNRGRYASSANIYAYEGNDYIINWGDCRDVTQRGGDGDDTIDNAGSYTYVSGGKGNDSIKNERQDAVATISGDEGNDTIICGGGGKELLYYAAGDGDDTVYNFFNTSSSDKGVTEKISVYGGGTVDTYYVTDSDLTIKIGDGSITFKDSIGKKPVVDVSSGKSVISFIDDINENDINNNDSNGANNKGNEDSGHDNLNGNENNSNGNESDNNGNTPPSDENKNNGVDNTPIDENTSNGYESFYSIKDFETLFADVDDNQEKEEKPYWTLEDLKTLLDAFNFYVPIPKVENVADVTARVTGILDSVIKIAEGEITDAEGLKGEKLKIIGNISAIIGDVADLKGKDAMGWALNATALEAIGSWISTSDSSGVELTDEEQERVTQAISATNDLTIEVIGDVMEKICDSSGLTNAEIKSLSKKIKWYINAGLAIMMIGYEGCNQFRESIKEGLDEELPVWVIAEETFADGIMAGIHGGVTQLTRGLDDLAFKGLRWLAYKVTGQEPVLTEKTYAEWIAEFAKRIMLGSSSNDDAIDIQHDEEVKYTQDGNDYIRNGFSKVTIYAGAGKDTVKSFDNTTSNFIRGDDGKDSIVSSSDNSTIKGGNGADKIIIFGSENEVLGEEENDVILLGLTARNNIVDGGNGDDVLMVVGSPDSDNPINGNKVYGEAGNDHIYLFGASNSTVRGGAGYDYIVLEDTNNVVIEYRNGHGKDVIVGYNETDTISFREETNYSTVASGNDITIYVGDGQIFLQGANGKALNIQQGFSKDDTNIRNLIAQKQQIIGNLSVVRSLSGDLRLRASEEEISVEDIRDNFIDVKDADGNTTAQVYMARAEGGEVAGNALGDSPNIFKVIVGASESKNQLIASDSGSSLFGGKTDDILQGGIGQDAYSYSSGNDTITNYESWEDITFEGTYQNWITDGDDFVLNAAEGSLRIPNAREKFIRVKNPDGSVLMNVCMASEEDTYDYSHYTEFVTAIGADNQKNILVAGNAGSVLWGGNGKTWDELYGGAGSDEFVYRYGNGHDAIYNASYEDTVNLGDITFDQIRGNKLMDNRSVFMFTDYGSLAVFGPVGTFIIDGKNYHADYENHQLYVNNDQ